MTPARIDRPPQGDERSTLLAFLDHYRETLATKTVGVTDEEARRPLPPSDLSLMGLVRHMAEVERNWFRRIVAGGDPASDANAGPIFYGDAHPDGDPDGDLHPGPDDTLADALSIWRREITAANTILDGRAPDDLAAIEARSAGGRPNLRWVLVHMIEEYARHCGHADLLREAIDGSTGD